MFLRRLLETLDAAVEKRGWAKEHNLLWWTRREAKRLALVSGIARWDTKSFEFWTLLMVVLAVVRPRSILELGSGRSTFYLAEYAMKAVVSYASIEQNRIYVTKIRRGLKDAFLDPRYVHHVPLGEDGWYHMETLNRVVETPCELLFVDGPVGIQEAVGRGVRRSEHSDKWLAAAAATSKIVIVDDVHRKTNLELFHALTSTSDQLSPLYLSYGTRRTQNVIAMGVASPSYATIANICTTVNIGFFTDYSSERCSET